MKEKKKDGLLRFCEKLKRTLSDSIFEDRFNCLLCDRELEAADQGHICKRCASRMLRTGDDVCRKCGRPQSNEARYCLTCQNRVRHFDRASSCYRYEGGAKELVYRLKFGNQRWLARYMAEEMARRYRSCDFTCDVVVPVPLSRAHAKRRGYNQAGLLAKEIARALDLAYREDVLIKPADRAEQAKLSGKEREENAKDAYRVVCAQPVADKRVLVIDDVLTTGATASAVAQRLKRAGAREVTVLTYCVTPLRIDAEKSPRQSFDRIDKNPSMP